MSVANAGILCLIHCSAQTNNCNCPPVCVLFMSSNSSRCFGSSRTSSAEIFLPHQCTLVVYKMYFSECSLRFKRLQKVSSRRRPRKRWTTVSLHSGRSSNQASGCSRRSSFNANVIAKWRCVTTFVAPCRAHVGVKILSGVKKLWYSWDSPAYGSFQYPWNESKLS